ncbi:metallophosphoesterase [Aliiroseovarius sp.]|uniref:metallophosphoesterase n=1 Tax=Aliiroseovarius sp. TaxID=1872442 RepID=UPI00263685E6|nr:metallophosphoesterase [Aliiroseovarius sp.]
MRAYAIGDIHGHLGKLEQAHALIAEDRARCGDMDAPIVHVGDLVDRGPDSRGVIQYLLDGQVRGENWVVLKGNHDRMAALFLRDTPQLDPQLLMDHYWCHPRIGGVETLGSYGITVPEGIRTYQLHAEALTKVPPIHRRYLDDLPAMHRMGELCFVHAGIRPGVPLKDQTEDDLTWIRKEFHQDRSDHGPLIIHGHTPVKEVTHYGNRLNIDTGAGHGKALSAVVIEEREAWLLTHEGRQPVLRG